MAFWEHLGKYRLQFYREKIFSITDIEYCYEVKNIQGKPVGREQYFLNEILVDLMAEGKVTHVMGKSAQTIHLYYRGRAEAGVAGEARSGGNNNIENLAFFGLESDTGNAAHSLSRTQEVASIMQHMMHTCSVALPLATHSLDEFLWQARDDGAVAILIIYSLKEAEKCTSNEQVTTIPQGRRRKTDLINDRQEHGFIIEQGMTQDLGGHPSHRISPGGSVEHETTQDQGGRPFHKIAPGGSVEQEISLQRGMIGRRIKQGMTQDLGGRPFHKIVHGGSVEKLTNHSKRKTLESKLKKSGQLRNVICEITGHAPESSLDDYDEIDENERNKLSHIISGYSAKQKHSTPNSVTNQNTVNEASN
ncbi:hypothetical protein ACROYT_G014411 [Oculina patagonica]